MADLKRMTVSKPGVTALDPKAAAKFAAPGIAGRVLNVRAETDGGGLCVICLTHPDGTVEKLAEVTVPKLGENETCVLNTRIATSIVTDAPSVAEVG